MSDSQLRLTFKTSREQIEAWATNPASECVVAIRTPWWSLYHDAWMPYSLPGKHPLPCDPRGSPLCQGKLTEFWQQAIGNPEHYGKHGLAALVAAFQGNVEVLTSDGRGWRPTSLNNWDAYNELIDQHQAKEPA